MTRPKYFCVFLQTLIFSFLAVGCASKAALTQDTSRQEYGEVGVYSTPPRAKIIVDGQEIVRSPAIICRVEKNKPYTFQVKREGYQTWEETVVLKEKRKNFHIKLIKFIP